MTAQPAFSQRLDSVPSANSRLPRLTSRLLAAHPGFVHGFTRRRAGLGAADGNVSYSGSRDAQDAWQMRQVWSATIGVDPERLVTAGQVHGNGVLRLTANHTGRGARPESVQAGIADALITNEPGVVLLSMHADCLPILLADPVGRAVGIVHAGWRGTVVDVAGAAVREMTAAYGTDPGTLLAYLGPAIGAGCYEVGADVASAWTSLAGPADQAVALQAAGECWTFDLAAANVYLLRQAGLRSDHIEASGICTRCSGEDWFSHRGQGPATGRFGAVIALEP
jgi:YfiH family protein